MPPQGVFHMFHHSDSMHSFLFLIAIRCRRTTSTEVPGNADMNACSTASVEKRNQMLHFLSSFPHSYHEKPLYIHHLFFAPDTLVGARHDPHGRQSRHGAQCQPETG